MISDRRALPCSEAASEFPCPSGTGILPVALFQQLLTGWKPVPLGLAPESRCVPISPLAERPTQPSTLNIQHLARAFFRVGYTSKEAFDNSMKNATEATMPGHLVIEGRVVRFEICMKCWRSMGETELTPDVETDAVH